MAVYRGFAFPFKRSDQQIPATVEDDELVRQSIIQIIMTGLGERVMRPDFGSGAYAHVFENNDALLEEAIKFNVHTSISKFEPRAILQSVDVERRGQNNEEVWVTVTFVVRATRNSMTVDAQLPRS